jgi:23S rRNA (cytosine1962-C5)-methyltransferase
MMPVIFIKSGREKSVLRRHPWIFSGAVSRVTGSPGDGETVKVVNSRGEFLGWGAFSSKSQISVRIWSWSQEEDIGADFFRRRLQQAIAGRQMMAVPPGNNSLRLVHAESDGLPGLVVDRYNDLLVVQYLSSGSECWRETLADLLVELTGIGQVFERSDVDVRALEGLPSRIGPLHGQEPLERIIICENGLDFWVDVRKGHKTGFYLDQRANRARLRQLAAGKDVLDCFCYTGGFTLNAMAGGASNVQSIDGSADALALARENMILNHFPLERVEWIEGDVFQTLRGLRDRDRHFDLIILDPPKFAPTAAQAEKAARGYKDINLLAFKLLRQGGHLVTFSCSGGVSEDLFQKIVAGAALDAGAEAQIVERLHQDVDHPVALNFPEGAYLKGFIIRKICRV